MYAKQKHLGCKKCGANQKQHCKQAGATKRLDISWGQEVALSNICNSLNDIAYFHKYDWLCHLATFYNSL